MPYVESDEDAHVLKPATLLLAALFAFIVLVQGISAPFQKDAEPQSAEWIQSIVRDGHWLIPHDAYGYTDRKPPLFYWLSAIVAKSSGGTVDEVRRDHRETQGLGIHSHQDRSGVARVFVSCRSSQHHVPGSGAKVAPGFGVRVEDAFRFDHDVDRKQPPGQTLAGASLASD